MTKRTIVATLALAVVAAPSIALAGPMNLAGSALVPAQAPTTWPTYRQSFAAFNETLPSWTIRADNFRYHGGPKSND